MGGALSAGAVFGWSSPAQYRLVNETEYGFPINDVSKLIRLCLYENGQSCYTFNRNNGLGLDRQ